MSYGRCILLCLFLIILVAVKTELRIVQICSPKRFKDKRSKSSFLSTAPRFPEERCIMEGLSFW